MTVELTRQGYRGVMLGIAQCRETHQHQLFLLACAWLHSWLTFPFLKVDHPFLLFFKIYFFVPRRAGSSSLHRLFLQLERVEATLAACGLLGGLASLAVEQNGLGVQAPELRLPGSGARSQQLWPTGLAVLRHVASSWTRD